METYLYKEMFELEERHWWFAAKHRIVLSMLGRYVQREGERPRVVDVGCGCGRMLQLLQESYDAEGLDGSEVAVDFSRQRGVKVVRGMLPGEIPMAARSFDAALMLDVLEHLDDDVASAKAVGGLLKDSGVFLVTVPAYQWLFGPHDVAHHHKRRYSAKQLRGVLESAGFRVRYLSYYNTILFPLAIAQRAASRIGSKDRPVSTAPPAGPINAVFGSIFAFERHLLGRLRLPFGLSLIAVAEPIR